MNDTKLILVKFIDGTSETIEAYYNPQDGYYGYLTNEELFYVSYTSSLKAFFPREFVKAISLLDE